MIALAIVPAMSQEIDCTEEFFRVSRFEDDCQRFFVCMVGGRVNFICEDGFIFDEERIECRAGFLDTCEFAEEAIPLEKTLKDFLAKSRILKRKPIK